MTERVKKWIAIVALAILVVGALLLIGVIQGPRPHSSYNDGYEWGYKNAGTHTGPVCTRPEMTSSSQVSDRNFHSTQLTGDGEPHDIFGRWHAGCEEGARAELHSQ